MSGKIFFRSSEISVGEKEGTAFVGITRDGDLSKAVTITYQITAGSAEAATADVDYRASQMTGTITLAAGSDHVSIPITILDDALSEKTESFVVSLIAVSSGELLAPRTSRIDILDDENPIGNVTEPALVSDYKVTTEVVASGLTEPLRFEFSPLDSSLMYIVEKGGAIKVFDMDTKKYVSTFVDLAAQVNSVQDRGLMDIAIHPDFKNHPYIYAFYVVDPPDTAGKTGNAGADGMGNRYAYVVRLEADPATNYTTIKNTPDARVVLVGGAGQSLSDISGGGVVDSTLPETVSTTHASDFDPNTGKYVQDYIKVDSRSHAGGALAFGPDGNLYISVGDGTSFNFADPRTFSVQSLDSLSGKILRVDPLTGEGVSDNPFVTAGMDLDSNRAKVYQLGLRNPFSISFDADGRLFITETGWNSYEEVNTGAPGANFGWPFYEGGDLGELKTNNYKNFPEAKAFFDAVANGSIKITPAFRSFSHTSSDPGYQVQAITGGEVVYNGSKYPIEFNGDYFFSDFAQGEIYAIDVHDRREVKFVYKTETGYGPTHFLQGPDGYIYIADIVTGTIQKLDIKYAKQMLAHEDVATTPDGKAVAIDVLDNDVHPTNAPIHIASVSKAANGTVVIDNNGTAQDLTDDFVRYTPNAGFAGVDTFTYVASDGRTTATGKVAVAVGAVVADENFETGARGWSLGDRVGVLDVHGKKTTALGQFAAGDVTQKTFDIPTGTGTAVVTFDLYELDSWDGGKDEFFVKVNGHLVLLEEFFHMARGPNWGYDLARSGVSGNISWSITPLTDSSNHGGMSGERWFNDQIHRVTLEIKNPGESLTIALGSTLDGVVKDESFAIDNFKIVTAGKAPAAPAIAAGVETFDAAPLGWSSGTRVALVDQNFNKTFGLGQFEAGDVVEKTFSNPLAVDTVVVSFDFYELDTWDGDQGDKFFVRINGKQVLLEDFVNNAMGRNGNDAASAGVTGNVKWSITPLTDSNANHGGNGSKAWFNDQIHKVTLEIQDPGKSLNIELGSTLDQKAADESFAIDNFKVVTGGKAVATTVINENFELASQGWSPGYRTALVDAKGNETFGLGQVSKNGVLEKSYLIPEGAGSVKVAFDFYELDTWDGDQGDKLFVRINGKQVLLEDFVNNAMGRNGNDPASAGATGNVTWSITPLTDGSTNLGGGGGAGKGWLNDQVHRVTLEIKDPGSTLHIGIGSTLDQGVVDESFAIDNFEITAFPDQHVI